VDREAGGVRTAGVKLKQKTFFVLGSVYSVWTWWMTVLEESGRDLALTGAEKERVKLTQRTGRRGPGRLLERLGRSRTCGRLAACWSQSSSPGSSVGDGVSIFFVKAPLEELTVTYKVKVMHPFLNTIIIYTLFLICDGVDFLF
jgi:hypothetical protein